MRSRAVWGAALVSVGVLVACGTQTSKQGVSDDDDDDRYHPAGFADAAAHGPEMKQQVQDCRTCHGSALEGAGLAPGCDSCHAPGWRTTCTFCHGSTDNATGAPPRDLSGATDPAALSFRAHTSHVTTGAVHTEFDCTQCHTRPSDVLSPEHAFDGTHGKAEVVFAGGLSAAGTYAGNGSCTNLYCHGNGQGDNGAYSHTEPAPQCSSCHPNQDSPSWSSMSGEHQKHVADGVLCNECHASVVTGGAAGIPGTILTVGLHVNGTVEVKLPTNITFDGSSCSGICHGRVHFINGW